jgi:asparagine synthase (glutamine-hydrolysing)
MCGIVGFIGQGSENDINIMTDSISYRGPDDRGIFFNQGIGLGHRRLSILDLSPLGHQPMISDDGNVVIVFNGEIYNFLDLKNSYLSKYKFKGGSDTEVILYLYLEFGDKVFSMIHGMFSIAIYDFRNKKLLLARDRMGKKPLYWGLYDNTLLFASEPKALFKHEKFKKEIDLNSLNKYFQFEYIPTPRSIYKGLNKLEPGHFIEFKNNNIKKIKFWDIKSENKKINLNKAIESLDNLMSEAVKKRMVADVPVGIFLSGGIDSSAIAYYAMKNSKNKIKTFSIGFQDKSFDELKYANIVSKLLNTEHYEKVLSEKDSIDVIHNISNLLDEPLADASIIPTYLLSKYAREHVTVALGGDGGDELFWGYDTFVAHKLSFIYDLVPDFIKKIFIKSLDMIPTSFSNISLDFKIKKFIQGYTKKPLHRHFTWLGAFLPNERNKLFKNNILNQIKDFNEFEDIDNYAESFSEKNGYDIHSFLYQRTYMMDDILVKVDRASMYNSLEVRTPFLDTDIVEFANSLPIKLKCKGLQRKYILKKLLEGKLPKEIIYRKKKGFGMPIAKWLRTDLKPLVDELLNKEFINEQNIFNYDYIKTLVDDHMNMIRDNRKYIWTLLVFQMWYKRFFIQK